MTNSQAELLTFTPTDSWTPFKLHCVISNQRISAIFFNICKKTVLFLFFSGLFWRDDRQQVVLKRQPGDPEGLWQMLGPRSNSTIWRKVCDCTWMLSLVCVGFSKGVCRVKLVLSVPYYLWENIYPVQHKSSSAFSSHANTLSNGLPSEHTKAPCHGCIHHLYLVFNLSV